MNKKKKRTVIISSIIAALFITPLIVFAVVYYSNRRTNSFQPADANIQVKEGNESSDELIKDDGYIWERDKDDNNQLLNSYSVVKPVQIYDERKMNDEYLRVRFIPMWYDIDGNVVGGADEFSDFSYIDLVGDELQFKKSDNATVLLTLKLYTDEANPENDWDNSWRYNAADQCFYYKGTIKSGDISPTLLAGAQISKDVFESSEGYTLHIEVLADAIQADHQNTITTQPPRW